MQKVTWWSTLRRWVWFSYLSAKGRITTEGSYNLGNSIGHYCSSFILVPVFSAFWSARTWIRELTGSTLSLESRTGGTESSKASFQVKNCLSCLSAGEDEVNAQLDSAP